MALTVVPLNGIDFIFNLFNGLKFNMGLLIAKAVVFSEIAALKFLAKLADLIVFGVVNRSKQAGAFPREEWQCVFGAIS